MKKTLKKLTALLLSAMLMTTALVGCSNEPSDTDSKVSQSKTESQSTSGNEVTTLRIMGIDKSVTVDSGKVALSDWVSGGSPVWDALVKELEDQGLRLELDLIPEDQYETVCQTRLAAGINADIMNVTPLDNQTRLNLVNQGKLIAVNDIYENHSKGAAGDFYTKGNGAEMMRKLSLEDGKSYWLTDLTIAMDENGEIGLGAPMAFMVRKDWLDALDLPIPTTTDELFNAMKAFQEKDVNKSGEPDEVLSISLKDFSSGIACFYGMGRDLTYVNDADGKVSSPWYHENIKPYIEFIKSMVDAGFVDTSDQLNEKNAENKIAGRFDWGTETWDEVGISVPEGAAAPYYVPVVLKASNSNDGTEPYLPWQRGYQLGGNKYAVTNECKDLEAVGRLLDYLVTDDYRILTEFGVKDYSYTVNEDGSLAAIKDSDKADAQVVNMGPALWTNASILPRFELKTAQDWQNEMKNAVEAGKTMGYPETGFQEKMDYCVDYADYEYKLPHESEPDYAAATEEELETISSITNDLTTYSEELLTRLVLGQQSMDDWDGYMADLQRLGLDRLIEVNQARYDRATGK